MTADRRARLQALSEWLHRGASPERVRLAMQLVPDGEAIVAEASYNWTVWHVRTYCAGRLGNMVGPHGDAEIAARLRPPPQAGEEDALLGARNREEFLEGSCGIPEPSSILRWYRRMTVAAARTSRLKAHAQGWRLP